MGIDQIFQIFQVMGTPSPKDWPSVSKLKDFDLQFPKWKPSNFHAKINTASVPGLDLIRRCLCLDPQRRCLTYQAIEHPWFNNVDSRNKTMMLGKWEAYREGDIFSARDPELLLRSG